MAVSTHTTHGPNWVSTHGLLQRSSTIHMAHIFGNLFATLVSFLSKPYKEAVKVIIIQKIAKFQESFESF